MDSALATERAPVRGLLATIYRDILADQTRLPSMPDVALRIRAAMAKPDYSVADIARVVKADAGTSAYLIRIANSPLYRGAVGIKNVETAISRLGMPVTRNLVTAYALKAMFKTSSGVLRRLLRDSWREGARRAALASLIAQQCGLFDPDRAMLAGLLQDIGTLPLLTRLEGQGSLPEPDKIADTLEEYAAKVGVTLLTRWEFDEEMIEVTRSRKDWWRNPSPKPDLADIVLVARLHATVGTAEMHQMPFINETPAFLKLPLGEVGPDQSLTFLREAEEEVQALTAMLGV